nr:hypothetical protein [Tanacetum cinerariifolium]
MDLGVGVRRSVSQGIKRRAKARHPLKYVMASQRLEVWPCRHATPHAVYNLGYNCRMPVKSCETDPSEDSSSDHIPPLSAIFPFLSSTDDTTYSDTPLSPTHGTPFTKITLSTQRSHVVPRCRVMLLAPRQPILYRRPYRYHLNRLLRMLTVRKRVGPSSSPDLPSTFVGPSRKRRRSLMTSVPALSPASGALSHVSADLTPSCKRVRDFDYLVNVEVDSRESSEPSRSRGTDVGVGDDIERVDESHSEHEINPVQATIEACFDFMNIFRSRGIDVRVVAETVARDKIRTDIRDIEERAATGTYETLGSLVQRFHDHTVAILVHRVQVIEGVQREQGRRIVRVESAVTALIERIPELERDNRRLRGTTSVEGQRVDRLQRGMKMPNTRSGASMAHEEIEDLVTGRVAEEMNACEAAINLKPLNDIGDKQEGDNGGNGMEGMKEMEMEEMGMEEGTEMEIEMGIMA